MPLTPEEIAEVKTAAESGTIPEFLKPVAEAGWNLRTAAQETTFKDTYKGQIIKDRDRELYTQFEGTIKEVSGIEKTQDEKATDYAKRAYSAMTTELTDLRAQKVDGTLSKADKDRLKQLEDALKGKDTDIETLKTTHKKELLGFRVSGDVGNAMGQIKTKLKKEFTGDALADIEAARLGRFNAEYIPEEETKDGKTTLIYRKDGDVVMNPKTYKPATALEILEGIFEPYMDKGTPPQNGGGSKPPGLNTPANPTDAAAKTKDTYTPPADLGTRKQLADDLKRNGILAGTEDFTALMEKYGKDSAGALLPLGR